VTAEGINFAQAELVMERLAAIAEPLAHAAGVGEMETVGHLVSYLIDHPRDIEPCLRFGVSELPDDWIDKGRLSYQARDGKIWRPEKARRARLIKKLEKSA
jgi:hypothetical protein